MEPRTTIVYKGITYPFYRTNRGKFDFENAGFTNMEILQNKSSALLALVYYTMIDCAKRAGTPIKDSFEEFIDNSDSDITEVFLRLKKLADDQKEAKALEGLGKSDGTRPAEAVE